MGILIVTMPNDGDAHVVKLAINKLGEECAIFYSSDFAGGAQWSFDPMGCTLATEFRGISEVHNLERFDSIWMRRPCGVVPREHLDDVRERIAAERESASLLNSVHRILEVGRFVANPLGATRVAQEKSYQFWHAARAGLVMPTTLISNCPSRVARFFHECPGGMIYKSLVPMLWEQGTANYRSVPTTRIDDLGILESSDLTSAPGIYQQRVDKVAEIRATILGRSVLAMEKRFPERTSADLDVDWRNQNNGARFSRHVLPDAIVKQCFELLDRLGLVMGCFDFALDAQGNYLFLEVNPQGQFIWADQVCPELNHLEAIVEFLLSMDPRFEYRQSDRIALTQFADRETYVAMERDEARLHHGHVAAFQYGTVTVSLAQVQPLPDAVIQNQVRQEMDRQLAQRKAHQ